MKKSNKEINILFFTMVVVMMGFGMVIPILPFYIEAFGAKGSALGALMATYAIMQFIFSPIWGSLSDRYGRKPILMIGIFGYAISQLIFGMASSLWMLFVARILSGILSSATLPTAMAYISDTTLVKERGGGMGQIGAAMGVGMVLGPGIAGLLAEQALSTPFYLAAGISLLALILVQLMLPETLPPQERLASDLKFTGMQFKGMFQALFSPIGLLLFLAFLVSFGLTNFEAVFGLYALEKFNYGPKEVGSLLTVIGLISAGVQGGLTGPTTRHWGEPVVIKASLFGSAFAFPLMLWAYNTPTVVLTISFFVLSNALLRPAVSSLTSQRASIGQGAAMGLNNAFMSLGRIAGPLLAGFLFDINIRLPYWIGGAVMAAGFLIGSIWLGHGDTVSEIQAVDGVE